MRRKILLAILFTLTSANVSFADLVEGDLYNPGDSLITLETVTGIEWLDVTYTQGRSYYQIWTDTSLISEGWRHATNLEVRDLFTNYGNELQYLQGLFGITGYFGSNPDTIFRMTHGFIDYVGGRSRYGDAFIKLTLSSGIATKDIRDFSDWDRYHQEPNVGHWLVRQSTSPVPIPGAIWLFGSGLLGLIGFKRVRDRNRF